MSQSTGHSLGHPVGHSVEIEPPDALAEFLARAEARLSHTPPAYFSLETFPDVNGDHVLQDDPGSLAPLTEPLHAAVLVPVVARSEPTVLLTLRAANLSAHAGQVAFPGGRVDPDDRDEVDAALREAREEVGLDSAYVRPLGFLDGYLSGTGFWIVPVVGLVRPDYVLHLNHNEVQEAFEVPLAHLLNPDSYQRRSRDWNGRQRHFYEIPYERQRIWGVTAGMLRNFYVRMYG